MKHLFLLTRAAALALALLPLAARAQNVGIGTTAPTQTLDVNGALRVRGLSGSGSRLPLVLPDGTLGVNAPVYSTSGNQPFPTAATGSAATGAYPQSVTVSGSTAYVVNNGGNTLQLFNVANPAAPVLLGTAATGSGPVDVAVSGSTAYVVNYGGNTLLTYDVANPAAPVLLGTVATGALPYGVAVSGPVAYVVNLSSNTLQLFNVANPAAPVLLGTVATGSGPADVAVSGSTAYVVNNGDNTLQVFDVANPAAPVLLGTGATGSGPVGVAVSGPTAYVVNAGGNTLQLFDVANPAAPVLLGTVATGAQPYGVAVSGPTAYVVNYGGNTLQAFNAANPAAPALLGTIATGSGPRGVAVSGPTAYVVNNGGNTLQVFSVPSSPRAVAVNADGSLGSLPLPSGADFVLNGTAAQAGGAFNVGGAGTVGGLLTVGSASIGGAGTVGGLLTAGSARINALTTAGLVTTDASGNLGSAPAASLDPTTAGNGLTKTGSAFALGGPLAGATTVDLGAHNLSFTGTTGQVGIGTTAPAARLQVVSADNAAATNILDAQAQNLTQGVGLWYGGVRKTGTNAASDLALDGKGAGQVLLNASGGTGRVGIGTAAPRAKLDVAGSVAVAGGVAIDIDNTLEFGARVAGKESSAGKIGYGTFSSGASLDIVGAGTTNANRRIKFYAEGGATFTGTVTGVGTFNSSDQRLKQDIGPLTGALAAVGRLRGVRYRWNALGVARGGAAGAGQVGLIAQELEAVYPELVSTDAQGFKAVNYAQLTPVLLEAIKEQQAQIEALKTRAATAEAKAASVDVKAASAEAQAAKATATLETFEARLRRLESPAGGQAQQ